MAPVCIRVDHEGAAYSTETASPVVTTFLTILKAGRRAAGGRPQAGNGTAITGNRPTLQLSGFKQSR
jgi:hypothetical protein